MNNNMSLGAPKTIFLVILSFLMYVSGVSAQELMVGSAKRVLTPNPILPVSGGVGMPKPATIKQGDLTARVMVMTKGNEKIAIVAIDNLGWPAALGKTC